MHEVSVKVILVATDFSKGANRAFRRGLRLAEAFGARLHVVHAIVNTPDVDVRRVLEREAEDRLGGLAKKASSVQTQLHLTSGAGAAQIVRTADHVKADLVIVGARGERRMKDVLFGTTAERVAERIERPLLVVRSASRKLYAQPLVCVGDDPAADDVLATAHALAPGALLSVLHVYEVLFEARLRNARKGEDAVRQHRRLEKSAASRRVAAVIERVGLSAGEAQPLLRKGYAPAVIQKVAKELEADLVAVGRHRSRVSSFFLGSVAKHVLRGASADVLLVPASASD